MALKQWSVCLILGLAVVSAPRSAHADEKISPEARGYFRNGVELLQAQPPNYQDAYYQFKLAFEKSQSWKALGNLGLCAVKLERDGESLSYYQEYLRRGGTQIDQEEREAIERDMLLIKGNGATLELTSKVSDLKIRDVRAGSTLSAQSYELAGGKKSLFVRAGAHRLTATDSAGRTLIWEASVEPGSTSSHDFDFDAPVAGAAARPVPLTSTPAAPSEPRPAPLADQPRAHSNTLVTVGFITAGVGIATLAGGVVTGLMANSKEKRAKDQCDANNVCDPSAEPLFDDASSLAKTSTVLLIGGGALSAVGAGMVACRFNLACAMNEGSAKRIPYLSQTLAR